MDNEIKDLTISELVQGFVMEDSGNKCRCIYCGEEFETGIIYNSRGRNVDYYRAAIEHVYDVHGGSFEELVSLDKQLNGLTDIQKKLLSYMHEGKDNKEIGKALDINAATVRSHKFNIQKLKREAKILLALLEFIENEEIVAQDKRYQLKTKPREDVDALSDKFEGNTLHPFFTNFNLK